MPRLLPLAVTVVLLCACTPRQPDIRYKRMTVEFPRMYCERFVPADGTNQSRYLGGVGGDRFKVEICATEDKPDPEAYDGPVTLQVVDVVTEGVLAEKTWANIGATPIMTVFNDPDGLRVTDGGRTFEWRATTQQMNAPHPPDRDLVLDYPNCIRTAMGLDMGGKTGFLFEYCYTAETGAYDQLSGTPGILRLSRYPGGLVLRLERFEHMDIKEPQWMPDDRQVLRFKSGSGAVEWDLPAMF